MHIVTGIVGLALVAIVLADAFQTVIVARHGRKIPAITRMFYRLSWSLFTTVAARIASRRRRERYLGIYGPLSLLMLLGFWAIGFIIAFAILQWSVGLELNGTHSSFANDLYFSAGSFFTLGSGEPQNIPSKYLMVLEAGFGFSFLGLVIGYCPYCINPSQAANFGYCCWMRGQDRRPPQFNFCSAEEATVRIWNGGLQTGRNGRSTYSTVIFHIRCSPTIGLNMRTNLGLPP